jgi:hypothetical protein
MEEKELIVGNKIVDRMFVFIPSIMCFSESIEKFPVSWFSMLPTSFFQNCRSLVGAFYFSTPHSNFEVFRLFVGGASRFC